MNLDVTNFTTFLQYMYFDYAIFNSKYRLYTPNKKYVYKTIYITSLQLFIQQNNQMHMFSLQTKWLKL